METELKSLIIKKIKQDNLKAFLLRFYCICFLFDRRNLKRNFFPNYIDLLTNMIYILVSKNCLWLENLIICFSKIKYQEE